MCIRGSRNSADIKRDLDAGGLELTLDGEVVRISADECDVRVTARDDYEAASSAGAVVVLSTQLDDDLRAEGFVRELVNRVQNVRKELDLGYTQRISLELDGDESVKAALSAFGETLAHETLAREFAVGVVDEGPTTREWDVEGRTVRARVTPL